MESSEDRTTFPTDHATPSADEDGHDHAVQRNSRNELSQSLDDTFATPEIPSISPSSTVDSNVDDIPLSPSIAHTTTYGPKQRVSMKAKRGRISSVSTLETTAMSDDQSCGSTSVRSHASVDVNPSRPRESSVKKNKAVPTKTSGHSPRRGNPKGGRSSNKHDANGTSHNNKSAAAELPISSRWDALKPDHCTGNANSNSNNKGYSHYQQHHRGGARRGGGGSHGSAKKGRKQHSFASSSPFEAHSSSATKSSRSRKNSARSTKESSNASSPPRNHTFSPSSDVNCPPDQFVSLNGMPLPPPGFQSSSLFAEQDAHLQYGDNQPVHGYIAESSKKGPEDLVTSLLDSTSREDPGNHDWNTELFPSSAGPANRSHVPFGTSISMTIQENPFSNSNVVHQADLDSQIEADLQELGGQMAGSILDF